MSLFALALALSTEAHASIYVGNPTIFLKVDRPAADLDAVDVELAKLRVNYCGGGYTDYAVGELVDLTVGYGQTITGGDLCGVRVYWDSVMTIESASFLLEYESPYTDVYIPSTPQPAVLTPFDVLQGSIYGTGPTLYVDIY